MGANFFGHMWTRVLTKNELQFMTIPVAEFMASVANLFAQEDVLEFAEVVVLEIDARASPDVLVNRAKGDALAIAHEEFIEDPIFARFTAPPRRLLCRHIFGPANPSGDACSRSRPALAEQLVRQVGIDPVWLQLPPGAVAYLDRVFARIVEARTARAIAATAAIASLQGAEAAHAYCPLSLPPANVELTPSTLTAALALASGLALLLWCLVRRYARSAVPNTFLQDTPRARDCATSSSPRVAQQCDHVWEERCRYTPSRCAAAWCAEYRTAVAPCTAGASHGDAATLTQHRPAELAPPAWRLRPGSAITTGYLHPVTASCAQQHGVQCRDAVASSAATAGRCDAVTPSLHSPTAVRGRCDRPGSPPSHSSLRSRSSPGPRRRIPTSRIIRILGRSVGALTLRGPSGHLSPCSCRHSASAG